MVGSSFIAGAFVACFSTAFAQIFPGMAMVPGMGYGSALGAGIAGAGHGMATAVSSGMIGGPIAPNMGIPSPLGLDYGMSGTVPPYPYGLPVGCPVAYPLNSLSYPVWPPAPQSWGQSSQADISGAASAVAGSGLSTSGMGIQATENANENANTNVNMNGASFRRSFHSPRNENVNSNTNVNSNSNINSNYLR